MGLFDAIREKATELLSGATDKVEGIVGDIPGGQAIEDLPATAAGAVSEAVPETLPDVTGSITDVTDAATGSVTETAEAVGEQVDPYRP